MPMNQLPPKIPPTIASNTDAREALVPVRARMLGNQLVGLVDQDGNDLGMPLTATKSDGKVKAMAGGIAFATLDRLGQSYVEAIAAANPNDGKMRVRQTYGDSNYGLFLEAAVPLPNRKWVVYRIGKETADGFMHLHSSSICDKSTPEAVYFSNGVAGESGVINIPAPAGGGWQNTAAENPYAGTTGDTFTFSFTGTGFDLRSYVDNRGGAWKVTVDGVDRGQISVWNSTATWDTRTGPRGLHQGFHTVVMTFVGADGVNAPTGGVARGWIARTIAATPTGANLRDRGTIRIANSLDTFAESLAVGGPASNVEAVIESRKVGAAYATVKWPWHGTTGSTAIISQVAYVDGVPLSLSERNDIWYDATRIDFVQAFTVQNPNETSAKLFNGVIRASLTADGYEYKVSLQTLQDIEVTTAYSLMCAMYNCDRVTFNNGVTIDCSAHNGTMIGPTSKAVDSGIMWDPAHPYALAYDMLDWQKSARVGRIGALPLFAHVQTRSDGTRMSKVYNYISPTPGPTTWYAGEVVDISGRFRVGLKPS